MARADRPCSRAYEQSFLKRLVSECDGAGHTPPEVRAVSRRQPPLPR